MFIKVVHSTHTLYSKSSETILTALKYNLSITIGHVRRTKDAKLGKACQKVPFLNENKCEQVLRALLEGYMLSE